MGSRATRAVTELEGTVLGVVGMQGPCTPYVVRRTFQESPSTYWSGSAGAIYPLMLRLERRGLLRAKRQAGDGRGGRLYSLTAAGERTLRAWLGPPCSALTVGVPPDPLRTRLGFLSILEAKSRQAFLADAAERMREQLRVIEEYTERQRAAGDRWEFLTSQGSLQMMQARLRWLESLGSELEQ